MTATHDYDDDRCYWCGGEGWMWGDEIGCSDGWYEPDECYPCPSCHGSGERKDMVLG